MEPLNRWLWQSKKSPTVHEDLSEGKIFSQNLQIRLSTLSLIKSEFPPLKEMLNCCSLLKRFEISNKMLKLIIETLINLL